MRLNDNNSGKKKPPNAGPKKSIPKEPTNNPPEQRKTRPPENRQRPQTSRTQQKSSHSQGAQRPRSSGGQSRPRPNGSQRPNNAPNRGRSGQSSGRGSSRPQRENTQSNEEGSNKNFDDIVSHDGPAPKGSTKRPIKDISPEQEKKKKFRKKILRVGIGIVIVISLIISGNFIYNRFISPEIVDTPESLSGAGSLKQWVDAVNNNDTDTMNDMVKKSLVAQEIKYAGKSESRQDFVKAVLGTVKYEIPETQQTTVYGKPVEKDGNPVMAEDDLMGDAPKVKLTYVDWDKVPTKPGTVEVYLEEAELSDKDPDIREKLTDVFSDYIVNLSNNDTLPTKTIEWYPEFDEEKVADPSDPDSGKKVTSRKISANEDANLDKVLFSGKGLWRLETRFSAAALGTDPGADWAEWVGGLDTEGGEGDEAETKGKSGAGTEEEGAGKKEDDEESKAGGSIDPMDESGITDESEDTGIIDESESSAEPTESEEKKEDDEFPAEEIMPSVGNYSFISPYWIGSWFLQKGIVEEGKKFDKDVSPIRPPVGDGSKDSPAGLNTSVLTTQVDEEKSGKKKKKVKKVDNPIRVELMQVDTDKKALDFYQSKDPRNRGFTLDSQVKYMSMRFKVTNLSKKKITVRDNSSLSDDQINLTDRTGQVFGLTRSVELEPGESGIIESWAGSPTLNRSYLIWGADFNRQHDVVWFRTLAGSEGKIDPVKDRDDSPGQGDGSGDEEGTDIIPGKGDEESGGSDGGSENGDSTKEEHSEGVQDSSGGVPEAPNPDE